MNVSSGFNLVFHPTGTHSFLRKYPIFSVSIVKVNLNLVKEICKLVASERTQSLLCGTTGLGQSCNWAELVSISHRAVS